MSREVTRRPTGESKDLRRTGRLVRDLTTIAKALRDGELTIAQAYLLADVRARTRRGYVRYVDRGAAHAALVLKYCEFEDVIEQWTRTSIWTARTRTASAFRDGHGAYHTWRLYGTEVC